MNDPRLIHFPPEHKPLTVTTHTTWAPPGQSAPSLAQGHGSGRLGASGAGWEPCKSVQRGLEAKEDAQKSKATLPR
jgi:hypothetical protein